MYHVKVYPLFRNVYHHADAQNIIDNHAQLLAETDVHSLIWLTERIGFIRDTWNENGELCCTLCLRADYYMKRQMLNYRFELIHFRIDPDGPPGPLRIACVRKELCSVLEQKVVWTFVSSLSLLNLANS